MLKIFLVLVIGSRQMEGTAPLSAFLIVNWNLLSRMGLDKRAPKSINSLFQILARSLSDTRASTGSVQELNNCVGTWRGALGIIPEMAC